MFFSFTLWFALKDTRVFSQSATIVKRVSVSSAGDQANNMSSRNDINEDGRYIVFASLASNLVDGDVNGFKDVFLRDMQTGETYLISKSSGGTQGNGESDTPVISADGRYIAYESYASNLVSGDTNDAQDIFLFDRDTNITIRVSVASDGTEANDHSFYPNISSDGQVIAFQSAASNLVAGDTNGKRDIFVHTHATGTTERVSISTDGDESNGENLHPSLSVDGRYVAFTSTADNLLPYVPEGPVSGSCTCASGTLTADSCVNSTATCAGDDCSCVLNMVPQDDNGVSDIYLRDRTNGTTERISVSSSGQQANGGSAFPSIDDDGSFIAYESVASNLVSGDTNDVRDVFVYDRQLGETSRVSVATDGTEANNSSGDGVDEQSVRISADGQYVVFKSRATNLVEGDTNGQVDVFVNHQRESFITKRVSVTSDGGEADSFSYYPSISSDGQYITFYSYATNIVEGDTNGFGDVFVYNQDAQTVTPTPTSTPAPTDEPTPTPTPEPTINPVTISIPKNTQHPTELDIETAAGTATIRCEKVNDAGTLTIYVLKSPPGQITNDLSILKTNYDITSSVLKCDLITVCLPYDETEVDNALLTEDELQLYHYYNNSWQNITSYIDTESNRICGRPSDFSPFVIGNSLSDGANSSTGPGTPTLAPGQSQTITPTPSGLLPKSGVTSTTIAFGISLFLLLSMGIFLFI